VVLAAVPLARFLYCRNPEIQGEAIEIDEAIVTLAKIIFIFRHNNGK